MQSSSRSGSVNLAMLRIVAIPHPLSWIHGILIIGQLLSQWIVVASIHRSRWSSGTEVLAWAAVYAVVAVAIIVFSTRSDAFVFYLLATIVGYVFVVWQMTTMVRALVAQELGTDYASLLVGYHDIFNEVIIRIMRWGQSLTTGEITSTPILFVLILSILAMAIAGVSTWWLLRRQQAWLSVAISAIPLFINYTFSPQTRRDDDLVLFTGIALVLIISNHLLMREEVWQAAQFERPITTPLHTLWNACLIIVPALAIASALPLPSTSEYALDTWARIRAPFNTIRSGWDTLLGSSATNQAGGFSRASTQVAGPRIRSQQEVLRVSTTTSEYLRATTFDNYTGQGWNTQARRDQTGLPAYTFMTNRQQARMAVLSTIEVRQDRSDNLLLSVGQPLNYGRDTVVDHLASIEFTLDSVLAVSSNESVLSGQVYTTTSMISQAYDTQLRSTRSAPPDIQRIYTALPASLPARVSALATDIVTTANATNAYDQAVALQSYLRQFSYDERRTRPPSTQDWVDYFLFESQRGYCDDFATAMTVLLRTQGIPARYVQGYALGSRDPVSGSYIIRESMAHSWVEVYFDDYGWQRFEPTPAGYVDLPVRVAPSTQPDTTGADTDQPAPQSAPNRIDSLERFEPPDDPSLAAGGTSDQQTTPSPWWWGVGVIGLASITWGARYWWLRREAFWRIHVIYQVVCALLRWGTFALPSNVTPWQVELTVSRTHPTITALIRAFLRDYTRMQYAEQKPTTWAPIPWSTLIIRLIDVRIAHIRATTRH